MDGWDLLIGLVGCASVAWYLRPFVRYARVRREMVQHEQKRRAS